MRLVYCFGDRNTGKSYLASLLYGETHTLLTNQMKNIDTYSRRMSFDKYQRLEEKNRPKKIIIDDESMSEIKKVLNLQTEELILIYNTLDALDYVTRRVKLNKCTEAYTHIKMRGKIHVLYFTCLID